MSGNAALSVVIPTYNRAGMLEKVLPSYLSSSIVREVIVVDDGSNDNTERVLARLSREDPRVRHLRQATNRGRQAARNEGISKSRYDLVLLAEDDLEVAQGALEVLAAHLLKTEADIIAGRRIWMRLGETRQDAFARANKTRRPILDKRLLDHNSHTCASDDLESTLVDATMLVRRQVFQEVEFPTCYRGNAWREESDFQISARAKGLRITFCPHATLFHHDRPTAGRGRYRIDANMRYLYWIFRNNLLFLRRHRNNLRELIPGSMVFSSPVMTSLVYLAVRILWLSQAEMRRARVLRLNSHPRKAA